MQGHSTYYSNTIFYFEPNPNCQYTPFIIIYMVNIIWNMSFSGIDFAAVSMIFRVKFGVVPAISAYYHWCCEFESRSGRGVQNYVIKFVSDLRQVGGFLRILRFPLPIKLTDTI